MLHVAYKRGGIPRTLARATLVAALALVVWLVIPGGPEPTVEERVSQFVGAWAILVMLAGLVAIAAAALGKIAPHKPSDTER